VKFTVTVTKKKGENASVRTKFLQNIAAPRRLYFKGMFGLDGFGGSQSGFAVDGDKTGVVIVEDCVMPRTIAGLLVAFTMLFSNW
jgi:hypothetical protein